MHLCIHFNFSPYQESNNAIVCQLLTQTKSKNPYTVQKNTIDIIRNTTTVKISALPCYIMFFWSVSISSGFEVMWGIFSCVSVTGEVIFNHFTITLKVSAATKIILGGPMKF